MFDSDSGDAGLHVGPGFHLKTRHDEFHALAQDRGADGDRTGFRAPSGGRLRARGGADGLQSEPKANLIFHTFKQSIGGFLLPRPLRDHLSHRLWRN